MSFRELVIGGLFFLVVRLLVSALRDERKPQEQAIVQKDEQAKRDAEAREEGCLFMESQFKMVRLLLFCGVLAAVAVGTLYFCFWRERPYVLIRFTAGRAIQATAEFQHKTKMKFAVARREALFPGTCEDFSFVPEKLPLVHEPASRDNEVLPFRELLTYSLCGAGRYHIGGSFCFYA